MVVLSRTFGAAMPHCHKVKVVATPMELHLRGCMTATLIIIQVPHSLIIVVPMLLSTSRFSTVVHTVL